LPFGMGNRLALLDEIIEASIRTKQLSMLWDH
jgi:hypothetical protein